MEEDRPSQFRDIMDEAYKILNLGYYDNKIIFRSNNKV